MSGRLRRANLRTSRTRTSTSRCISLCCSACGPMRCLSVQNRSIQMSCGRIACRRTTVTTGKRMANQRSTGKWGTTVRIAHAISSMHTTARTAAWDSNVTSEFCTLHRQKRLAPPGAKRKARPAARGAGASPRAEPSDRQIRRSAPAAYALEVHTLTRCCRRLRGACARDLVLQTGSTASCTAGCMARQCLRTAVVHPQPFEPAGKQAADEQI